MFYWLLIRMLNGQVVERKAQEYVCWAAGSMAVCVLAGIDFCLAVHFICSAVVGVLIFCVDGGGFSEVVCRITLLSFLCFNFFSFFLLQSSAGLSRGSSRNPFSYSG